MPDKRETISLLEQISEMLDFKGENRFKINAYKNAANSIRRINEDFDMMVKEKRLHEIRGLGDSIQSLIYKYYVTGESSLFNELKKEVPDGIEELLRIKGLGAKKINILYNELGITSIGELEYACNENRLAILKGFGQAVQDKILKEIENYKKYSKFVLINTAETFASEILTKLNLISSIKKVEISGGLRRGEEIFSSLHFILLLDDRKKFLNEIASHFEADVEYPVVVLHSYFDIPVNMHLTETESDFVKQQFLITGSDEFIRELAIDIAEINCKTEEDIFKKVDAPFVIPEMREKEYFEAKKKYRQNSYLGVSDYKGLLHFHSTFSDGRNTLEAMIRAAVEVGFDYAAICDHSKSAYYANGLKEPSILQQSKELARLAAKYNIRLFQGIESDILKDGSLDYDEDFLKNIDFVVASIHSRFGIEDMTGRMLRAIENPFTDLLAHPSGRMLLSREPYKFNIKKIIDACAANDVAIEINSNPRRMDIEWRWIYYGREKGVKFSINPDAHSIAEIGLIKYGTLMGRKAGLQPGEVINCYDLNSFKKFLNRKVKREFKAA